MKSQMQEQFFFNLKYLISEQRIGPYRVNVTDSELITYARYAWNLALCESLYPALNGLEIALRNGIHNAATYRFGDEYWFDSLTLGKTRDSLKRSREKLASDAKKRENAAVGDLVSQLNFGFWVGLFDSQYEQVLWTQLLRPVFPYIPRTERSRNRLSRRLHSIRMMRNRVFHHEPIWNHPDLKALHGRVLDTIGWISWEMRRFIEMLDRFPNIYSQGPQKYEQEMEAVFQSNQESQRR